MKTINKESKKKFPEKSFGDLELDLSDRDIISYAYFLKQVEYLVAFEETDTARFNGEKVRGFYSDGEEQDENVEIIKYWSDDKFIISLKLKDDMDELILAKGFDMDDPEGIVYEINDLGDSQREILTEDEVFRMPNLHLDYHRDYEELLGKFLANQGFEDSKSILTDAIKDLENYRQEINVSKPKPVEKFDIMAGNNISQITKLCASKKTLQKTAGLHPCHFSNLLPSWL